jgi:Vault protein inter-alpha-trypsin domain/von Willebrand factor type A domain
MILSTTSRTTLTQTFLNPSKSKKLDEVQYTFPLYDGVTVVGFECTVAGRLIVGVVKEKQQARKDYKDALDRGQGAALLEQSYDAADCFTTRVGNVPADEKVLVEITYLGELKNDAETDGIRFTIPTAIAPRYGTTSDDSVGLPENPSLATDKEGTRILVDIAVEDGVSLRGVQSPSHPIAITLGRTSSMPEEAFDNQHASATLTLGNTQLDKDFIIVVTSKGHDTPRALMETHPTIPNHRALMATLVPKFSIPAIHPEIVFVADRSGSMGGNIDVLVSALKIFLKSLPVGVKFNICSFGSSHTFLWNKSKTYDESSLSAAIKHVDSFTANFGGTEMLNPVKDTIKNRYKDMPLEVIVATDGQIWNQDDLFNFINEVSTQSVRFFSLGIGHGASSSLVEGIARAGDGFAQFVGENEKMEKRIVRMLKGALTPHIKNYTMEVKYEQADEDYEMVEPTTERPKVPDTSSEKPKASMQKVISLFDESAKAEDTVDKTAGKYDHLPSIGTPKLLQAPHKIPPLYSFNRTSIYLLSADSSQHKPKAIVLRATSDHGPLQLEIPVQDVGTGETIHQLAARKAIHELEEERGWITEAKDDDGKLIKTRLGGRWDEVVEREGVRLGVKFQVGSKWCSFVAVEKDPTKPEEGLPDYVTIEMENTDQSAGIEGSVFSPSFCLTALAAPTSAFVCFSYSCHQQPPLITCAKGKDYADEFPSTGVVRGYSLPPIQVDRAQMVPMSSSMLVGGSAPLTAAKRMKTGIGGFMARTMRAAGAGSAPPSALAAYGVGFARLNTSPTMTRSLASPSSHHVEASCRTAVSPDERYRDQGIAEDTIDYCEDDSEMADEGDASDHTIISTPMGKPAPMPNPDEEKMHELISLQTFDGSWKWAERLFEVLGLEGQKVKAALVDLEEAVMATLLAVAFLEGKMSAEEGVWEMVVEKARGWLEGRVGLRKYEVGLAKVKNDILGVA